MINKITQDKQLVIDVEKLSYLYKKIDGNGDYLVVNDLYNRLSLTIDKVIKKYMKNYRRKENLDLFDEVMDYAIDLLNYSDWS